MKFEILINYRKICFLGGTQISKPAVSGAQGFDFRWGVPRVGSEL